MEEKIERIPEICEELLDIYNEIKREAHKECTISTETISGRFILKDKSKWKNIYLSKKGE